MAHLRVPLEYRSSALAMRLRAGLIAKIFVLLHKL
jgi:hypothetical protein